MSRDWRTTDQLREHYHFSSRAAVRKFLARHHVPSTKRGPRIVLVDRRDFDAAMEAWRQQAHGVPVLRVVGR